MTPPPDRTPLPRHPAASRAAGATAIIPARLASTRMPGKVLADATGRPMIRHVYERASAAASIGTVVVATDHERIARAVEGFGGRCLMTSPDHPNGTSRLAEASTLLGLPEGAIVVNVQGDEPELDPALIDAGVEALTSTGAEVATVASPMAPGDDPVDPNLVKVVLDCRGWRLYFSRSQVPHAGRADPGEAAAPLKHVGLYVYTAGFLRAYAAMSQTPLELTERLEQLRILEHGFRIAVAIRSAHHHGIDTPEQYEAFVRRWNARGIGAD